MYYFSFDRFCDDVWYLARSGHEKYRNMQRFKPFFGLNTREIFSSQFDHINGLKADFYKEIVKKFMVVKKLYDKKRKVKRSKRSGEILWERVIPHPETLLAYQRLLLSYIKVFFTKNYLFSL